MNACVTPETTDLLIHSRFALFTSCICVIFNEKVVSWMGILMFSLFAEPIYYRFDICLAHIPWPLMKIDTHLIRPGNKACQARWLSRNFAL